jgi:hypothetical protein
VFTYAKIFAIINSILRYYCAHFAREIKLKKELETLKNLCIINEKTIDEMVYELYGLSDDEIKIVEG